MIRPDWNEKNFSNVMRLRIMRIIQNSRIARIPLPALIVTVLLPVFVLPPVSPVPVGAQTDRASFRTPGTTAAPLQIPRTDERLRIDGELDEAVWSSALVLSLEVEVSPGENVPAPVRTEVLLIHSGSHLYAAFRCHDPDPGAIRAHLSDRDILEGDDYVSIVLDTFNDERRCYTLLVNPLGVQGDMIEAESGGDNPRDWSWDAIWNSAGRTTAWGYTVELAIPFTQLRFQRSTGSQIWGFDAVRFYPRSRNHLIGAFPRDRSNNIYLSQALKIEGFAGVSPGRNIELYPTVTGVRTDERASMPDGEFDRAHQDAEVGLTAGWGITPNMTLNATLNPDFSQVEADAMQLDINQPFALYYREQRPFFIEGYDFFDTLKDAVYTRTMRDPEWGLKLTGKVGDNTIGGYVVRDNLTNLIFPGPENSRSTSLATESTAGVLRYRRDLGPRHTIGALATHRQAAGYSNQVVGLDTDVRISRSDQIQLQVLGSRTGYPDSIDTGFDQPGDTFTGHYLALEYDHTTRTAGWWLDFDHVSDDFRADLGFIPRVGFRNVEGGVNWSWNPEPGDWWSLFRLGGEFNYYEKGSGQWLERGGQIWGLYVGPLQSNLMVRVNRSEEAYGGSEYSLTEYYLGGGFRPHADLRLGLSIAAGDRIDYANNRPADGIMIAPSLLWNPGEHLHLSASHMHEKLTIPGGELYTAGVTNLRTVYQFTVRTFLRAIVQYVAYDRNTALYTFAIAPEYRHLFTQLLFSYTINPRTVFYLGYSDNGYGSEQYSLTRADRTVFTKLGYALGF